MSSPWASPGVEWLLRPRSSLLLTNLLGRQAILVLAPLAQTISEPLMPDSGATLRTSVRKGRGLQGQTGCRSMRPVRRHRGTPPGQFIIGEQGTPHTRRPAVPLDERHLVGSTPG